MDGVFMKKIIKLAICLLLVGTVLVIADIYQDKQMLQENLVRLHVVANSDSDEDQQVKLQVKDAVVNYLRPIMEEMPTKEAAMEYLRDNLAALQTVSNRVLDSLGIKDRASVTLRPESFDTRVYDTFSLPSGIYDSLRIEIGEAEGKNWWCVTFPSLCLPATSDGFADTAVSAGFSQTLTDTLSGKKTFHLRFFLLDCFGSIENLFHKG